MQKSTQANGKQTIVGSVLEAAAGILSKDGYLKSTTNKIAERAGVSIGSLYYYFRTKDAVYQKLADEIIASYLMDLDRKINTANSTRDLNLKIIDAVVDFTFENRDLLKNLFSESARLDRLQRIYSFRNQFAKTLTKRFLELDQSLDSPDFLARTHILVNAINGVLDSYIFSDELCPYNKNQLKVLLSHLSFSENPHDQI